MTAAAAATARRRRRAPIRPARLSIFIDTDSWCAGVLDACAIFDLRPGNGGRLHLTATLKIANPVARRKFTELTGITLAPTRTSRVRIPARKLDALLSRMMPRMIALHEEAGVVYRYLLTRLGGRRGVTKAVARYRVELIRKAQQRRKEVKRDE